jgi:hypothetical protein
MEVNGQLHDPAVLPRRKEPGTHWIGGWLGPRAGLDAEAEGEISYGLFKARLQLKVGPISFTMFVRLSTGNNPKTAERIFV